MLCTPGRCQHVSPGAGLSARGNRQARRAAPQHEPERTAGSGWSPPKSGLQESDQQDRNPAAERDKGVREPPTEDREHRNSEAADRYVTDCQEPLSWCQPRHLEPLRSSPHAPIPCCPTHRAMVLPHQKEDVLWSCCMKWQPKTQSRAGPCPLVSCRGSPNYSCSSGLCLFQVFLMLPGHSHAFLALWTLCREGQGYWRSRYSWAGRLVGVSPFLEGLT